MAERASALANLAAPAAAADTSVVLAELPPAAIIQVTAWPDTAKGVSDTIAELVGTAIGPVGSVIGQGAVTAVTTAPGRFLLVSENEDRAGVLSAALPADEAAITDLSHARTVLRLSGGVAADVLGKGLALDLHPSVFAPGQAAQSVIHHMDVLVIRREQAVFDLMVFRGFGLALAEWLLDAGLEYGIGFQPV
ncbi:MAG TPA: sarcosine oxidase subunit gamma family protein [Afifellaceae bacterium]|nr:sarcosine oxidase subunit gamma family protein [Afifellaceae bacterium]